MDQRWSRLRECCFTADDGPFVMLRRDKDNEWWNKRRGAGGGGETELNQLDLNTTYLQEEAEHAHTAVRHVPMYTTGFCSCKSMLYYFWPISKRLEEVQFSTKPDVLASLHGRIKAPELLMNVKAAAVCAHREFFFVVIIKRVRGYSWFSPPWLLSSQERRTRGSAQMLDTCWVKKWEEKIRA